MSEKRVSWSDYLYIGMAFAVMLSMKDEYRDGFLQVIPVLIFFVITGLRDNVTLLKGVIRRFPVFAVMTAVWTVYFGLINRGERISYRYAIVAFLIVFAGYAVARSGKEAVSKGIEKLWLILFIVLLIGVVEHIHTKNYGITMAVIFTHHIPESVAALTLAMLSLFGVRGGFKKTVGLLLAGIAVVFTMAKSSMLVMVLAVVIFLWFKRKEIIRRNAVVSHVVMGVIVVVIILFCVVAGPRILRSENEVIARNVARFTSTFSSMKKDLYLDYYGDPSYRNRAAAVDQTLNVCREGSLADTLLGGGLLSGYYRIKPLTIVTVRAYGELAGPAENAFLSLFSDYGAAAFILFFGVFISAVYSMIRTKKSHVRVQAIYVVLIMCLCFYSDMEYWMNMIFPIWIFIGMYLGTLAEEKETDALVAPMLFSVMLATVLLLLPCAYSWLRTTIHAAGEQALLWAALHLVTVVVLLWGISLLVATLLLRKKSVKMPLVVTGVGLVGLVVVCGLGVHWNSNIRETIVNRIDSEREIVATIREAANGEIYNDTYPLIYTAELGDIKGTLFSGASLAATPNATVIVDRGEEAQRLFDMGFLYTAISENDAIYTNDQGVVVALQEQGYHLTGYYPERIYVSNADTADGENAGPTEAGEIVLATTEPVILGAAKTLYPGMKTLTCNMRLAGGTIEGDVPVATLLLRQKGVETEAESFAVTANMFDENGKLSLSWPFSASGGAVEFLIRREGEQEFSIGPVSYIRTPDYDTHVRVDDYGRVIHEEYFDLEGNPIEATAAVHGIDIEYTGDNEYGDWTKIRYLNRELQPMLSDKGYAEIRRELDGAHRVIREEYYGEDLQPLALSTGQAAVDYAYDEAGNLTMERYYNERFEPTLYQDRFCTVRRTYNEQNRNILEEYFGTDDQPIAQTDGACGYAREYDEAGNETRITYLGTDGEPVLNTSGYATLCRTFDEEKHLLREDFFDAEDQSIALASGQAIAEYEYDGAGNRVVERYYDAAGKPVLYYGQFWCVKRVYNDQNQNIHEEFLGKIAKPIPLSDGAYGYDREYDNAGNIIVTKFLGADGNPAANTSGYAILRRTFDGENRIVREEYYDSQDQLWAFETGQAIVEYEYDDVGNRTVDRFYDASSVPVLYMGQFWYVRRTYNENRQNILEMFYGVDDQPVVFGDGASGYGREYDEAGNESSVTYLGTDGNPILNTSGYAICRSIYDDQRRVIREEYFGPDDTLALCNGEFASQDIRYDDAGAVAGRTYYDLNGDVVREE